MGGNAIQLRDQNKDSGNFKIARILRAQVPGTIKFIAAHLSSMGITEQYIKEHLMGSIGKQDSSGDIDIALDDTMFTRKNLADIAIMVRKLNGGGNEFAQTKTIKGGQINTAWPIDGDPNNKFVQVDFILGNPEWLKFTHHSPGMDHSPYKGVWISTLLGILAKFNKDFEVLNKEGIRVARVGLQYDLELGLYRRWEVQLKSESGPSDVEPEVWESYLGRLMDKGIIDKQPIPRFTRIGYIDSPSEVVRILFGPGVKLSDVDTFEKAWGLACKKYPERREELKERLVEALLRSGLKHEATKEEIMLQLSSCSSD